MKNAQHCGLLRWRMGHETHNVTLKKLGKKGQFVCDLVKNSGGGAHFFFREGGSISKGGHVPSFERGGPLAWGSIGMGGGGGGGGNGLSGEMKICHPNNSPTAMKKVVSDKAPFTCKCNSIALHSSVPSPMGGWSLFKAVVAQGGRGGYPKTKTSAAIGFFVASMPCSVDAVSTRWCYPFAE